MNGADSIKSIIKAYAEVTNPKKNLFEGYKNFIGPDSRDKKELWVDEVWDILQQSYESLGGIKGSGFRSKQDMINNIPFWKLYTRAGKLVAVAMYKDKSGRKAVAIGTDGSDLGKRIVGDIFKSSLGVSYGEKSGPALATMMKSVSWEELRPFLFTPKEVEKITRKKVIPIEDFGPENLDPKDLRTYEKYPELIPYFYLRDLGGALRLKVLMGTPNLKIR